MKPPRNVPASVRQRLLNRARIDKRPFNELLQYYAMERFLYRLSRSAHGNRFILKGALMLRVWSNAGQIGRRADLDARSAPARGRAMDGEHLFRPTMDIDMLGRTSNDETSIVAQIQDILAVEVEADGLTFDPSSIQAERITEDADYKGIRVRFRGDLDSARVSMQIDIGFGDIVYPEPEESNLPTMLDSPVPRLLCYSRGKHHRREVRSHGEVGNVEQPHEGFLRYLVTLPPVRLRRRQARQGNPANLRTARYEAALRNRGLHGYLH